MGRNAGETAEYAKYANADVSFRVVRVVRGQKFGWTSGGGGRKVGRVKSLDWFKKIWNKSARAKKTMDQRFQEILQRVEPIQHPVYGPLYRCSLILKDGISIPCATLQSKTKLVELAERRIKEEMSGKGMHRGPDALNQILSTFVAHGNNINDYDIASAAPSKFAPPISLLNQIHGETCMGWTGWVFEMKDGKYFPFGTDYIMEFFQLPDGYSFDDVAKVHNHSYVSADGTIKELRRGHRPPDEYDPNQIYRERPFFTCYIDDIR